MIDAATYKRLFEKLGETGALTEDELKDFHEYEKNLQQLKYGRKPDTEKITS